MTSKFLSTHSLFCLLPPVHSHPPPHHAPRLSLPAPSSSHLALSLPASRPARTPLVGRKGTRQIPRVREEGVEGGGEAVDVEEDAIDGAVAVAVEEKAPRKPIVKLGDIMGILNKRAVEAAESERPVPDIRTGDIVEIKLEVPENKRRASIYKGIVMSRQNAGIHTTIRIRRIIAGIGVEIVFPLYSPNIKEIKVVKHRKVRRARLYYLRDKLPRLSTFK